MATRDVVAAVWLTVLTVGAIACSGPGDAPTKPKGAIQITDLEFIPAARTCPAVTPVTFNGAGPVGNPATYSITYSMNVVNGTSADVTINGVTTNGVVTGATDDMGLGRSAQVSTDATFGPGTTAAKNGTTPVTGSITFLCGLNPSVHRTFFWDISTAVTVSTSGGVATSASLLVRRTWDPCGDPGHPCPATQPAMPTN